MRRLKFFLFIGLIFSMTFALYAPYWESPFVLDDLSKIKENVDLRLPSPLPTLLYDYRSSHSAFRNDPSRPLVYLAYWSCWHLADGDTWPFHALNTFLHAVNGSLILIFTFILTENWIAALFSATLYITSPLLAGSVAYAYGLSDILSTTFTLFILVLSLRTSTARAVLIALLYVMALGTKQSSITVPALLLATDLYRKTNLDTRRLSKIYLPLFVLSAFFIALRLYLLGGLGDLEGRDQVLPAADYFSAQGLMILKYISLLFAPIALSIDHCLAPWNYSMLLKLAGWILVSAGIVIAAHALSKIRSKMARALAWSWLFFVICLIPTSSIFPTVDLFVERRAFTAACGIFIALGVLFNELYLRKRRTALILFATLFVSQGALALRREKVFESPETVWQESLQLDPNNPRALVNLAIFYSSIRHWEESIHLIERLIQLQPQKGSNYSKLAYIYGQKDFRGFDENKAWALYEKSLALDPENIFAWYNAGLYLEAHEQVAKAEEYFARTVAIAPNMTLGWISQARTAYKQKKFEFAQKCLERALQLDPNNIEAVNDLIVVQRLNSTKTHP